MQAGFAESSDVRCGVEIGINCLIRAAVIADLVAVAVEWYGIWVSKLRNRFARWEHFRWATIWRCRDGIVATIGTNRGDVLWLSTVAAESTGFQEIAARILKVICEAVP